MRLVGHWMNGKRTQTRYALTTHGEGQQGAGRENTLMIIDDYRLDPPLDKYAVPPCPKCGAGLYGYLFLDIDGDVVGCTECVTTKDPWEYVEMLEDEK